MVIAAERASHRTAVQTQELYCNTDVTGRGKACRERTRS